MERGKERKRSKEHGKDRAVGEEMVKEKMEEGIDENGNAGRSNERKQDSAQNTHAYITEAEDEWNE